MTFNERFYQWNIWYDGLPREWRFQFVLWPLIVLGAFNIMLTISAGFPFGLLVLLGILLVAAIRVPYMLGPGRSMAGEPVPSTIVGHPPMQITGMDWLVDWNRRYDAMPELRRFWVVPAVLVIAGVINMLLTIGSGFPFGLLFLLALLAIVAVRAPYTSGWLKSSHPLAASGYEQPSISHTYHPPAATAPTEVPLYESPPTEVPPSEATYGVAEPPADYTPVPPAPMDAAATVPAPMAEPPTEVPPSTVPASDMAVAPNADALPHVHPAPHETAPHEPLAGSIYPPPHTEGGERAVPE